MGGVGRDVFVQQTKHSLYFWGSKSEKKNWVGDGMIPIGIKLFVFSVLKWTIVALAWSGNRILFPLLRFFSFA